MQRLIKLLGRLKKKKYLLFAGLCYYPQGGVEDLVFEGDSVEECKRYFSEIYLTKAAARWGEPIDDWADIVEKNSLKIIQRCYVKHTKDSFHEIAEYKWTIENETL